jgi:hypothetical protein
MWGPRRVQGGAVFGGEVQAVEGALDEVPLIERWANDPVDVGPGEADMLVLDRGPCDDRREGEEVVGGDRAPERLQQVGDDPAAAERVENGSAVELIEQRGEVRNQAVLRPHVPDSRERGYLRHNLMQVARPDVVVRVIGRIVPQRRRPGRRSHGCLPSLGSRVVRGR